MNKNISRIYLENQDNEFIYNKNKSKLNISFNRVAFIFFIFFIIVLIYSIHLVHLGSRKPNTENINKSIISSNSLYRADIVERNNN